MEASATRMLGEYDKAASLFRESVELNRKLRSKRMVAAELSNLGFVEIHRDRVDEAELSFAESDRVSGTPGAGDPYGQGMTLLAKAAIAFRKGNIKDARKFLSKARTTFSKSGLEPGKDDKFEFDWLGQHLEKVR
jgi:tetratricopeptide (TPR) repeat protein